MTILTLPYFGNIETNQPNEYTADINYADNEVWLAINFDKDVSSQLFEETRAILENIDSLDKLNRQYIDKDFNQTNTASIGYDYLHFYLEEPDELDLIDDNKSEEDNLLLLKQALTLDGIDIQLYKEEKVDKAVISCDYVIDSEISDQILTVITDIQGNLSHITWES